MNMNKNEGARGYRAFIFLKIFIFYKTFTQILKDGNLQK